MGANASHYSIKRQGERHVAVSAPRVGFTCDECLLAAHTECRILVPLAWLEGTTVTDANCACLCRDAKSKFGRTMLRTGVRDSSGWVPARKAVPVAPVAVPVRAAVDRDPLVGRHHLAKPEGTVTVRAQAAVRREAKAADRAELLDAAAALVERGVSISDIARVLDADRSSLSRALTNTSVKNKGGRPGRRITPETVAEARGLLADGTLTVRAVAARLGVDHSYLSKKVRAA